MTVLETQALNKRFGSLVVADAISLSLPEGARSALIASSSEFPSS